MPLSLFKEKKKKSRRAYLLKALDAMRVCPVCQRELPQTEQYFSIREDKGIIRFRRQCKNCISEKQKNKPKIYAPKKGKTLVCPICQKEFYVSRRHAEKAKYCSLKCKNEGARIPESRGKLKCKLCGKQFEFYKCTRRNPLYCSHSCKAKDLAKHAVRITVLCDRCGKPIIAREKAIAERRNRYGENGKKRIFCSNICAALSSDTPSTYNGGKRKDLGIYVRSTWEANYARYLNFLVSRKAILKWEYEPDTFWFEGIKRGTRSYTPDFKVYESDGSIKYHEVKGYLDEKSKTKLQRMSKYHPGITIILICKKEYVEIGRKVGRLIPFWEYQPRRTW